jgi:hypothetical protein
MRRNRRIVAMPSLIHPNEIPKVLVLVQRLGRLPAMVGASGGSRTRMSAMAAKTLFRSIVVRCLASWLI